jgi:ssDNA-binding Zn-finger/Zn-ribbon topoisomerase 1
MLVFGLDAEGRLRHVSSVDAGKQCGCICPKCKAPLLAKQGRRRAHHFAHASGGECSGSTETALHLFAKDVIAQTGELWLPAAVLELGRDQDAGRHVVEPETCFVPCEVRVEPFLGDVVPDLVVRRADRAIAIEVVVTNGVSTEKVERFRSLGIDVLRIDLSKESRQISPSLLSGLVTGLGSHKTWVLHRHLERRTEGLRGQAKKRSRVFATSVEDCPVPAANRDGRKPADIELDCRECPNLVEVTRDFVFCTDVPWSL